MKFSRQGKLIFSTADPVCAAQILNLDKILETPISTAVTFENISERFLVFDIPTNLPLSELAAEIMHKNDMEVVELRRFVKLNSTQEFSPYSKDANFYFWGFQPTPPLLGRKNIYAQKRRILDWLNQSHFSILNTSTSTHITHNFTSSVIDLTLCSAALLNEVYCYVSDCTFESDHLPIVVSWSKLANASKYFKTIYWNPILRDSNTFLQSIADPTVEIVTEKISHTININTKNQILPNNEYPPWWNIACNNFCHLKKIMWKKARNSVSVPDWIRYKKYRRNFPDIVTITKWTQNRRQDILIARIISRMIVTPALLNRFNLDSNPFCHSCNECENCILVLEYFFTSVPCIKFCLQDL
ncbi:putative RNA-directed DNA polymerase from transposon BS [Caerostris extrusa]|uniref:RNA-directed DNA polymerase from transposon BS n=1 Tax=Caerostris extrusa TaxID=172846 RepID=A0AAV4X6M1_CAEEX|nr:putative RNA-directed DNA polymerase from transposon BS [Caerostris extrusa]